MSLSIEPIPYLLHFKFAAGTSRGVLQEKKIWILKLSDTDNPGVHAYGECGPLSGLSVDDVPDFESRLYNVCEGFNQMDLEVFPFNLSMVLEQVVPENLPSVRFGIETTLLDYLNGNKRVIFPNNFSQAEKGISINGLIWMGPKDFMLQQIEDKLKQGYTTLKIKVGALDFEQECAVLSHIRSRYSPEQIEIRVDANGAFSAEQVHTKLERLAAFNLHSIEQPVKAGQTDLIAEVAAGSPIPVVLDEELIGVKDYQQKHHLLKVIQPPYIILKPSLLGGFQQCREWIEIANRLNIGWWITSALESNIGLNAIAQFTGSFRVNMPQGLGTGQLYHNNFPSPLSIQQGHLYYQQDKRWDFSALEN